MRAFLAFLADFFRDPDGSSSMTRLCMLLLALGAAVGMATGHDVASAAGALGSLGLGAVRNRPKDMKDSADA